MSVDNKRLPVPEKSFSPHSISKHTKKQFPLIDEHSIRKDDRLPDQLRPIFFKVGVITQAVGSSYLEFINTKTICAVYGPREVSKREDFSLKGQIYCELKFATFSSIKRRQHQQDAEEKEMSLIVQQAMESAVILSKFPKTRVDIFITILEDDGGALACALTSASLALSNAGIEMYDLVIGCSLRQKEKLILMDPSADEEYKTQDSRVEKNTGSLTIGLMPVLNQVAAIVNKGFMECESVIEGMKSCIDGCHKIYPVIQNGLIRSLEMEAKNLDIR